MYCSKKKSLAANYSFADEEQAPVMDVSGTTQDLIRAASVSKFFPSGSGSSSVLLDLDFAVCAGQVIAIIGKSGSGKSTLLHILGLLEQVSGGAVFLSGQDCTNLSENQLAVLRRENLGFVYQFHHLLPEFSAIDNLHIAQMIKHGTNKAGKENASSLLDNFGLKKKIHCYPGELSGGEKQRVAIARALINRPKILLADEPTGNLDHDNAELVFEILLDNVRNLDCAAVIVTHNMELAKKADKMFLLEKGKLRVV